MKKLILGLTAIAAMAGSANAATTILSENFESGSGAFTLSGNAYLANGALYNPCCGTPNDTSNTFVAFGGGNQPSGLASASFSTVLNQIYSVMFDYGALGGGTEPLVLTVAGQTFTFNPIADNSLVTTFQNGQFDFIGNGGLTSLVITSGGVDNVDAIVDNIAVTTAVPEPSTWAMMLFGFGAIGFSMRRRRRILPQVA